MKKILTGIWILVASPFVIVWEILKYIWINLIKSETTTSSEYAPDSEIMKGLVELRKGNLTNWEFKPSPDTPLYFVMVRPEGTTDAVKVTSVDPVLGEAQYHYMSLREAESLIRQMGQNDLSFLTSIPATDQKA